MNKEKGAPTKKDNSDFEHLKVWQDNPDLDYYQSEDHWNFHVNNLLYKNLLVYYEGKEVGAFLDVSRDSFTHPINDYTTLYGALFNEAYRLCYCILSTPVPETKVAQFANQAATWKFRNIKDENGETFEVLPNVIDLIESYHILGMVNAILSFANDQKDTIDRFLLALSVYKDKGLPFLGYIHCFESYNEGYRAFIVTTMISCSELRPDYDYKRRDEHLRYVIPLYKIFAEDLEKKMKETKVNMEETVLDKISANEIRFYYEGWRNGKHGAICQWNGIYRFVEQSRGKTGILDDVKRNKDDNPIVAIGIVAYWLQFNSRMNTIIKRLTKYKNEIPKDIREQFDNYTKIRFEQFREEHRDDPNTLDWDWEYEFYVNTIIPHEIAFNKRSEALFDYISDSDINLVKAVMKSYIKYLKKCRAEKGYRVSPELLVLRAVDSQDNRKYEDLEDFEVNTILDKLESEGYIKVAWIEGHKPEAIRMLDKGRAYLKQLEKGSGVVGAKHSVREISWEEEKQCFKAAVLHVMEKKKEDGNYLFEKSTQWKAVYRFAIDIGIMYDKEDPNEPKDLSTPQYANFVKFAQELQLDVNPPTRLPFTKNAIDDINKKYYVHFNAPYPWSLDGLTDQRSFTLYTELNDVYKALEGKYYDLVFQAERRHD